MVLLSNVFSCRRLSFYHFGQKGGHFMGSPSFALFARLYLQQDQYAMNIECKVEANAFQQKNMNIKENCKCQIH